MPLLPSKPCDCGECHICDENNRYAAGLARDAAMTRLLEGAARAGLSTENTTWANDIAPSWCIGGFARVFIGSWETDAIDAQRHYGAITVDEEGDTVCDGPALETDDVDAVIEFCLSAAHKVPA